MSIEQEEERRGEGDFEEIENVTEFEDEHLGNAADATNEEVGVLNF